MARCPKLSRWYEVRCEGLPGRYVCGGGHKQREGEGDLKTLVGRTVPAGGRRRGRQGKGSLESVR